MLVGERTPAPIPPTARPPPADSLPARLVPMLTVATHMAVAAAALAATATSPLQPLLLALTAYTLGVSAAGAQAASHELIHSRNGVHLAVAAAFLTSHWWYPYYRAHHQHHLHVCTPVDYTCAARGRDAFSYLAQYVPGSYAEAWQLSVAECKRAGKSPFSVHNSALVAYTAQALLAAAIYLALGPAASALHAGTVGLLVTYMGVYDYVLHYGLTRPPLSSNSGSGGDSGGGSGGRRFAPFTAYNAWSSLYPIENAMFFNVLYHGDHHLLGYKSYGWLRPAACAPTFPAPINMLALSVFVPPLWRAIMDGRADQANEENRRHLGVAAEPVAAALHH